MTILSHAKDDSDNVINTTNISLKSIGYNNRRDAKLIEDRLRSITNNQQRAMNLIAQINTIINNIRYVQNALVSADKTMLESRGKEIP